MYNVNKSALRKLQTINYGFLLCFKILTFLDSGNFEYSTKNFPKCRFYDYFIGITSLETSSGYIIPSFPSIGRIGILTEETYDYGYFPIIFSGLYYYSFLGVDYSCSIIFKNRYGRIPDRKELCKWVFGKFNEIMSEAGHEINYGIVLDVLNSFRSNSGEEILTCTDFLLNWNF